MIVLCYKPQHIDRFAGHGSVAPRDVRTCFSRLEIEDPHSYVDWSVRDTLRKSATRIVPTRTQQNTAWSLCTNQRAEDPTLGIFVL